MAELGIRPVLKKQSFPPLYHVSHTFNVSVLGEMHIATELSRKQTGRFGWSPLSLACLACQVEHMETFSRHLLAALSITLTSFFSTLYILLPLTLRVSSLELLGLRVDWD